MAGEGQLRTAIERNSHPAIKWSKLYMPAGYYCKQGDGLYRINSVLILFVACIGSVACQLDLRHFDKL